MIEAGCDFTLRTKAGETALHVAASQDQRVVVASLLLAGASPEARDSDGETPLHAAVRGGALSVVGVLQDRGVNIEASNSRGEHPLHLAAQSLDLDVLEELVAAGARLNEFDRSRETPLFKAVGVGWVQGAIVLVHAGADLEYCGPFGQGALHAAAREGDERMVRLLLELGSRPDALDERGHTPYLPAVSKAPVQVRPPSAFPSSARTAAQLRVKVAHDRLPNTTIRTRASFRKVSDSRRERSTLFTASSEDEVKRLVDNGADPRARNSVGQSPLHTACDRTVSCALLAAGADPLARTRVGETTLHTAISAEVVELLLAAGVDGESVDRHGRRPLHTARSVDVAAALVHAGCGMDSLSSEGTTPLFVAIREGRKDVSRFLIESGATTESLDGKEEHAPAFAAVFYDDPDTLDLLFDRGARVEGPPHPTTGFSRMHYAASKGWLRIVKALLDAGHSPQLTDKQGKSALDLARQRRNDDMVRVLSAWTGRAAKAP